MGYIESILLLIFFQFVFSSWMPTVNFSPNFQQFHRLKSEKLDNVIFSSISKQLPKNFQWQSIASVSLLQKKLSYVIYGGNQNRGIEWKLPLSMNFSLVVICKLSFTEDIYNNFNINNANCEKVVTGDINFYLGAAIKAISLSEKDAVIVYCDPLWHPTNITEPKPGGKCYLHYVNEGNFEKNSSIEFCRLSSTSFLPCLGGFSVDLLSTNEVLPELQLLVGMPYLPKYGNVKIFNDPFGSKTQTDPRNGFGSNFNFGYAVSINAPSIAYASSPLSDYNGSYVTNIRRDIILRSPKNANFISFGFSLNILNVDNGKKHAVVIGAPFYSSKVLNNVGSAYIYCITNDNNNVQFVTQIAGEKKDEFYGYSISNIGDINKDGNDDLAVSSPFLNDNDARGFVSIYTLGNNCEINSQAQQVLKSNQPKKEGIFGLSITGGTDIDFNTWPDVIILSSHSNSIEIYASRTKYNIQCQFSLDNNYETERLEKNKEIIVKIYVSLLDVKSGENIDLTFLKQFKLISQIDPNYNSTENRFKINNEKATLQFLQTSIFVKLSLKSLMHVKDMNLSIPFIFRFRFIQDCTNEECNQLKFPLINWDNCKTNIKVQKFICNVIRTCDADLSIELSDQESNEVIYGYDKTYSRVLELQIFNAGPTEGKDINFKVTTFQNIRIHNIKSKMKSVYLKVIIKENQTEAICMLDDEELDKGSKPIVILIEVYFEDFKNPQKMNFYNNSVSVQLFSDVKDSNKSNNIAQIDYTFVYRPNVTSYGSPLKETVIDLRNRSLLIRHGQRLMIDLIGPRLSQQYVVENSGNASITNMVVTVNIPMETFNGLKILYFFDKIRGISKSDSSWMTLAPRISVGNSYYPCTIPSKYVNPLNIIGFESHALHLNNIDIRPLLDWKYRVKRKAEYNKKTKETSYIGNKMIQRKMYRIPLENIQCNRPGVNLQYPKCAEMKCKVPLLPPNKQAKLQINAWLWSHTFFKKKISDIMIYTTLKTDFVEIPKGVQLKWDKSKSYSQAQQFIFQNVKPKIRQFKPLWPIIVGIVIGTLILAILVVAMYKCGFFKRNKIKRRTKKNKSKNNYPIIIHPVDMKKISNEELAT